MMRMAGEVMVAEIEKEQDWSLLMSQKTESCCCYESLIFNQVYANRKHKTPSLVE
jgi:hypothetical protein